MEAMEIWPYRIEYSSASEEHLRTLIARQQRIVLGTVDIQLMHEPTVETRNRKPMRPSPVAPGNYEAETFVYTVTWRKTPNPSSSFVLSVSRSPIGLASVERWSD